MTLDQMRRKFEEDAEDVLNAMKRFVSRWKSEYESNLKADSVGAVVVNLSLFKKIERMTEELEDEIL